MTLNSKHRQKKEQLKNNDAETQKTKHRNKKKAGRKYNLI